MSMQFGKIQPGSGDVNGVTPDSFSLDPFAGLTTWAGKPILDASGVIDHLTTGGFIKTGSKGVITYSFYDGGKMIGLYNNPTIGFGALDGLAPFTSGQKDAARAAIKLWDDLIPQTFVETNRANSDIVYANSADPAQAYSYTPDAKHVGYKFISDVFTADPQLNMTNTWFDIGGYGNTTLIHETGHSLGLTHPSDYNFGRDTDGDGFPDPITYADDAEYAQDTDQYSIMSYFSGNESGNLAIDWNLIILGYAQTPMVHDILAIQSVYGADSTTRSGATTYGFNSNAGNILYDFNHNPYPYLSIYDAGGNDTIDTSGFVTSQFIDLHPGSFSSIGGTAPDAATINAHWEYYYSLFGLDFPNSEYFTDAEVAGIQANLQSSIGGAIAGDTGVDGILATEYSNFSIAYNTIIENAVGGSARDLLWGNDANNVLSGMGGDDVIEGFKGNDTLIGGSGSDTFVFGDADKVGTDTINDFQTGVDKIDLTGLDVTALNVTYNATSHQVQIDINHDGTADMFINSDHVVNAGDYLFHA